MSEAEPGTCSCRDRDTRVLRAIIAAASRTNDPDRALPTSSTDLPLPKIGSGGNNVERLVQLLVHEGITPGDLLMAAWQSLPGVPMAVQSLDDYAAFVAATRANVQLAYFARDLARQVHDALMAQRELERRLDDDIRQRRP